MRSSILLLLALQVPIDRPTTTSGEQSVRREAIERMNEGVEQFAKGDVSGAERALKQAIEIDPGYAPAHVNLARLHFAREHFADAGYDLKSALELAAEDSDLRAEIHYDLGHLRLAQARVDGTSQIDRAEFAREAADAFARAREDDYQAQHQRGLAFDLLDDAVAADRSFRACIALQPDYGPCWSDLAWLYFDFGHEPLAEEVLALATETNSIDASLWLASAELQLRLGHAQQALDPAKKAAAIDPELHRTKFVLGMAYADLRMVKEAREQLSTYLQLQIAEPEDRVRAAQSMLAWLEDRSSN